jgi:hypothetical protein
MAANTTQGATYALPESHKQVRPPRALLPDRPVV